jgi:hypothetical protein
MASETTNAGALDNYRVRPGHSPRFGFVLVLLAEFKRAIAAERRHSELKHMDTIALAREGIARADVPRRVFEEYYSSTESEPATKSAVHQGDASRPHPSPNFSGWEGDGLGYRRTVQQQVIDLTWRKIVTATIYRLFETARVIDGLRSFERVGLSETSGAEFEALR